MATQDKFDKVIKMSYRLWKNSFSDKEGKHPNEESLAAFSEGTLPEKEILSVKRHLLRCSSCSEAFMFAHKLGKEKLSNVPQELISRAKSLVQADARKSVFEALVRVGEDFLELLSFNGEVILGNRLMPAPTLRSRALGQFKDELTLIKDLGLLRVELRLLRKDKKDFILQVTAREKKTLKPKKSLRITLFKDNRELESYACQTGKAIFKHLTIGEYDIEVNSLGENDVFLKLKIS